MFNRLLDAGISIAGVDVGESWGNPDGRSVFTRLYKAMVRRGFSSRPCMLARSRGGLMVFNWALDHRDEVGCIAGIYPVLDICCYPGIEKAAPAYHLSIEEMAVALPDINPIDRIHDLHVPIFLLHGDADVIVPLWRNSAAAAARSKDVTLRVVRGGKHDGSQVWFQSEELIDFLIKHMNRETVATAQPSR